MQLAHRLHVLKCKPSQLTLFLSLFMTPLHMPITSMPTSSVWQAWAFFESLLSMHTASVKHMIAVVMTPTADQQGPWPSCLHTTQLVSSSSHHPKLTQFFTLCNFVCQSTWLLLFWRKFPAHYAWCGSSGKNGSNCRQVHCCCSLNSAGFQI